MAVCSHPGCPTLTRTGTCDDHRREPTEDRRPSASQRGYDGKWNAYAKRFRAEHPWCVECWRANRKTPTAAVDHIVPVTGPDDPRFWDPTNHQSLCRSHHQAKTRREGRTARHAAPAEPRWWFTAAGGSVSE